MSQVWGTRYVFGPLGCALVLSVDQSPPATSPVDRAFGPVFWLAGVAKDDAKSASVCVNTAGASSSESPTSPARPVRGSRGWPRKIAPAVAMSATRGQRLSETQTTAHAPAPAPTPAVTAPCRITRALHDAHVASAMDRVARVDRASASRAAYCARARVAAEYDLTVACAPHVCNEIAAAAARQCLRDAFDYMAISASMRHHISVALREMRVLPEPYAWVEVEGLHAQSRMAARRAALERAEALADLLRTGGEQIAGVERDLATRINKSVANSAVLAAASARRLVAALIAAEREQLARLAQLCAIGQAMWASLLETAAADLLSRPKETAATVDVDLV